MEILLQNVREKVEKKLRKSGAKGIHRADVQNKNAIVLDR
jgi:hypothetical protein